MSQTKEIKKLKEKLKDTEERLKEANEILDLVVERDISNFNEILPFRLTRLMVTFQNREEFKEHRPLFYIKGTPKKGKSRPIIIGVLAEGKIAEKLSNFLEENAPSEKE